jgi:serine/threonine protein kinase
MSNIIGQILLNQYRVDSFVAAGGMGTVYCVFDLKHNVPLAMKVLHADLADDPAVFKRFQREARALQELRHPNIVPFYGLYQDHSATFLLEAFISGSSLQEILRQNRSLPLNEVLTYMKGLCAALGYAHSHNIVHCDVKPGNVMVSSHGNIYLTDFGIARFIGATTTTTMGIVGTPGYMSPEQVRGENPMPTSDIYSLGILLYEMAAGRRPFTGQSPHTTGTPSERIRQEHLQFQPPSPRLHNPAISTQLEQIILCCLEKEPSKRFYSAGELINALQTEIAPHTSKPITTMPAPPEPEPAWVMTHPVRAGRNKGLVVLAIMIFVVILMMGFLIMTNSGGIPLSISTPVIKAPMLVIAATTQPVFSQPSFSVRPYNSYTDSGTQPLWGKVADYAEITAPGRRSWKINSSPTDSVLLNLSWCAADEATLNANVAVMEFSITINEVNVSDSQLNIFNGIQNGHYCHYRMGILSGLSQGKYKYVETMRFKNTISDGTTTYNAGDYIYELMINTQ